MGTPLSFVSWALMQECLPGVASLLTGLFYDKTLGEGSPLARGMTHAVVLMIEFQPASLKTRRKGGKPPGMHATGGAWWDVRRLYVAIHNLYDQTAFTYGYLPLSSSLHPCQLVPSL